MNVQTGPSPDELFDLVDKLEYRPGWKFTLMQMDRGQGCTGLTLDVITQGYNSYHPERGENYRVHHYFPVPPAAYNRESWQHWIFDCLVDVERHEAMEFFMIDGFRPYAPHHGPGHNPYIVFEHGTDEDVRTRFTGEVKES